MTNQQETKDIFSICQNSVEKFFNDIEKTTPKYQDSAADLQKNYINAWKNVINSAIALEQEYATKAGINTNVPSAALKAIRDTTEEVVKAYDVQNKVALAAIDATQQNIKTFNDNAKAFADLNKNILQSWISTFAPRQN